MPTSTQKRIIIVDDDPFLTNMYSTKLKSAGYEVDISVNGADLISKLKEAERPKPHLILLDMILPGMEGTEIIEKIRTENIAPETKIVVLSNQNQPVDIEKAKGLGISGYLVKASMIPSEVVEEVGKILAK
jgi:CheY-like chemotaxis protein